MIGKQTKRDKEDLLILRGPIAENAFLHPSEVSLKLGFRPHFPPGDMKVKKWILSSDSAHLIVAF